MDNGFSFIFSEISKYLSLYKGYFIVILIAFITLYYFGAFAIYSLSKKVGISSSFISFIPFLQSFALGRLAEKYQKKNGRKSEKLGIILFIFNIIQTILLVFFIFMSVYALIDVVKKVGDMISENKEVTIDAFSAFIPVIAVFFVLFVIAVCYKIFYAISLWRIFTMFDCRMANLYTFISVICTVLSPMLLFVIKNNNLINNSENNSGYFEIK